MIFLPEQIETLRQLSDLWPHTPFVLIGANALALQMDLQWRQTNDLDFVISIALEDYPAGLATLSGWQRRREGEHAWLSPTGVKVDVVPAGPGLLDAGSLIWPESGYRMNLIGLRLAFEHHVHIPIDAGHSLNVLEGYLDPLDDRRWELPSDFENSSAFALGMDVGSLINPQEGEVVTRFVAKARDEDDRQRTHVLLIRNGPWRWREHPEVLFERLAAFEKGMQEALSSR